MSVDVPEKLAVVTTRVDYLESSLNEVKTSIEHLAKSVDRVCDKLEQIEARMNKIIIMIVGIYALFNGGPEVAKMLSRILLGN